MKQLFSGAACLVCLGQVSFFLVCQAPCGLKSLGKAIAVVIVATAAVAAAVVKEEEKAAVAMGLEELLLSVLYATDSVRAEL